MVRVSGKSEVEAEKAGPEKKNKKTQGGKIRNAGDQGGVSFGLPNRSSRATRGSRSLLGPLPGKTSPRTAPG